MCARRLVLAALLTLSIPAPALAQQGGAAVGADEQFKLGREAMNQKDYKRALELLRASHAREPGKGKLLNIALCEEQLGMTGSALRHFQELATQFPSGDERAGIAKQHADALDAKAPRLRVTLAPDAPPGTSVTLDGEALGAASLGADVAVDPGHHVVVARGPQGGERQIEVEIAAGEHKQLLAAPGAKDAPGTEKPGRPIGWTVGVAAVGVGGAALVAGIGVGIAALGKRSLLAQSCDANRTCRPDVQSTIDAYHTLGGASTALVIGGAALAAGGAVLMVLAPGKKPAQSGWITPEIGPGMVGVRGTF